MAQSKSETAAAGNRLVLSPEQQSRLSLFGRVAVNADLMQGKPLRFHEGMTLDDAVVITGLPREEAARRLRDMRKQADPKLYAIRHLSESAGQDYAGQERQPKPAEAVHLAFWGEDYRAAPNAIFRSALFPALNGNQKENRRYLENEDIFCVAGLKVFFTGKQFDQFDLDVYLEILNLARRFALGEPVEFSAYALLKALGLPTGGSNHARLHSVLIRLCAGVIDATDHEARYFGQLLHGGIRDEVTMNYRIRLNPEFAVLFSASLWSKIDLGIRRALGKNSTAKSLHAYYSTHINPLPHNIETLANMGAIQSDARYRI
jgi:TrfA protein